jgi:4-diphosphocytidyl-2-C-methyl-D-erythritol kinase
MQNLESAPAKVNLFLHVGDRRADGYHDLTSLVVFSNVGDELTAEPHNELALEICGPFAASLDTSENNLVLRAARALQFQCAGMGRPLQGAKLTLTKNLPLASGVGGGSADAAATLRTLNRLWALNLAVDTLRAIALTLGSDVPVCLDPKPQWMEGRGERLAPGPKLPELNLVLVNPKVEVPTAPVFLALKEKSGAARPGTPIVFSTARELSAWLTAKTRNDLQPPAIQIAPQIAIVLQALAQQPGCLIARMSGSGATCFALFETPGHANAAAAAMPAKWWASSSRR